MRSPLKACIVWRDFSILGELGLTISQHGTPSGIFHSLSTTAATHIKPHGALPCMLSQALGQGPMANPLTDFCPSSPHRGPATLAAPRSGVCFLSSAWLYLLCCGWQLPPGRKVWVIVGFESCFPLQEHCLSLHIVPLLKSAFLGSVQFYSYLQKEELKPDWKLMAGRVSFSSYYY